MRIALVSWECMYGVAVGGVAVHVTELAAALRAAGHEVHVFSRLGRNQNLHDLVFGVHYHRCPVDRHASFVEEIRALNRAFLHYLAAAAGEYGPFAWVDCHNWLAAPCGVRFQAETGARLSVTFHSTEWGRRGDWPEGGEAGAIAALEREAVEAADLVVAVSREVLRELQTLYRVPAWKSAVVHHGVDVRGFDGVECDPAAVRRDFGWPAEAPLVLYVGRLVHAGGADLLLEAVPAVAARHPEARFVVVGTGSLMEHLRREVARHGLDDRVALTGWAGGRPLGRLYRGCDLVCLPARREPYGVTVLNAWAARKPVLATRVGAPAEFVWDNVNGRLVEVSAEAVASGLIELLDGRDELPWMGQNGRTGLETAFTWRKVAEERLAAMDRSKRMGPDPAGVVPESPETAGNPQKGG